MDPRSAGPVAETRAQARRVGAEPAVSLRPVGPEDDALLHRIYASTREQELALVDWTAEQKAVFVRQQFEAQRSFYAERYASASHDVIVVDGDPGGRLYVDRGADEIRIVDIALLPAFRSRGVGRRLLGQVLQEGAASGRAVTIHVERFNPAQRLYARLGFVPVQEVSGGIYQLMRWTPPERSAPSAAVRDA